MRRELPLHDSSRQAPNLGRTARRATDAGDEEVLVLGRGLVLTVVASRVPAGRVTEINLWKSSDQSRNAPEAIRRNTEHQGAGNTVELVTGDLRELPFPDESYDLITSGLAVHHVLEAEGRKRAIDEAVRVLRPGGRLPVHPGVRRPHDRRRACRCRAARTGLAVPVWSTLGASHPGFRCEALPPARRLTPTQPLPAQPAVV